MEAGKPPPRDPRSRRSASASQFMCNLCTSVVCWLLIGSVAYGPAAQAPLGDAFIPFAVFFVFAQLVTLTFALEGVSGLWPGRVTALLTAGIAGGGAASMYAILAAGGWTHWGQGLFWALAGIYGGGALEAATGFWFRVRERLERTG